MKASVAPAETRRVLADIADAVTAAAVDRVLQTASPSIWGDTGTGYLTLFGLFAELGFKPADVDHGDWCVCCGCLMCDEENLACNCEGAAVRCQTCIPRDALPFVAGPRTGGRHWYAPWRVSPHLFGCEAT